MTDYYVQRPDGTWVAVDSNTGVTIAVGAPGPAVPSSDVIPYVPPPPPKTLEEEKAEAKKAADDLARKRADIAAAFPSGVSPLSVALGFVTWLVEGFNNAAGSFYNAYVEVYSWIWPFYLLAYPLYAVVVVFNKLAWAFSYFGEWVYDVSDRIGKILSWDNVISILLSWFPWLGTIGDWFQSWWSNVASVIAGWWSATQWTVRGWIDAATQYFNSVATAWNNFWNSTWPGWVASFNGLKSAWDNFWTVTLPNLVSFSWLTTWWNAQLQDVMGLVDSAFAIRRSLWEGWQDMRDNVVAFFTDPVEFIWDRFTDWFLGPEG